jgi:hypothetical protein
VKDRDNNSLDLQVGSISCGIRATRLITASFGEDRQVAVPFGNLEVLLRLISRRVAIWSLAWSAAAASCASRGHVRQRRGPPARSREAGACVRGRARAARPLVRHALPAAAARASPGHVRQRDVGRSHEADPRSTRASGDNDLIASGVEIGSISRD